MKRKLAEIIYDDATGDANIVWDDDYKPEAPLDLALDILLHDSMVDIAHDASVWCATLQKMMKVNGSEVVH